MANETCAGDAARMDGDAPTDEKPDAAESSRLCTDGGRDSPKGDLRVTLDRDDIQHLLKNGTAVVSKDVGPITVNLRTHQQLNAVVTVSGRRCDPDPEVVDE